jgi:hypothetical protein
MDKFYKRFKLFGIFAMCFLLITLVPASIYNIINKNWELVLVTLLAMGLMSAIWTFLFGYYRNIVIKITFHEKNTIITTNSKVYSLPSENFVEVNDSKSFGRIFILYSDGRIKKKFIFQKRYSPFKSYSLDINQMRVHMTSAIFKES